VAQALLAGAGVSVIYADSTPTASELLAAVWECDGRIAESYGASTSVAIAHGRRVAWIEKGLAGQPGPRLPGQRIVANAIPTTLGASTSEDAIVLLADPSEVVVGIQAPSVRVLVEQPGDVNLSAVVLAHGYVAIAVRRAESVGKVTGSGLVAPW
jgi:hypothetical protein